MKLGAGVIMFRLTFCETSHQIVLQLHVHSGDRLVELLPQYSMPALGDKGYALYR